jgi:hypothetical protein
MFLVGGALVGMPIRPEEIEAHMRNMIEAEIVQILEDETRPAGDPPITRPEALFLSLSVQLKDSQDEHKPSLEECLWLLDGLAVNLSIHICAVEIFIFH